MAWLIRNPGKGKPRCGPEIGPADDAGLEPGGAGAEADRVPEEWFDVNSDAVPA